MLDDVLAAPPAADAFAAATAAIIQAGRRMDRFGWVPATAGNISLRLPDGSVAITRSGGHKGFLDADGVIRVDLQGRPLRAGDRSSAETGLHCGIYRRFPGAGAVLHGHSVPVTHLSRSGGDAILLEGYELLKAFPGLPTHAGTIALPVVDNDQDIGRLQAVVERRWDALAEVPPGYLIRGHGIYVWGADMPTALTRLEALEFMLACELEKRRAA
ncbi:methylthioribulose 1-phosphate dehydratase [Paracraurococcus lichenis]|uniref:Methylthioribulose-1-phosphate dehydratase n=1 Tax=Paracraurococcus lichenis TaxID=3064888 RepID=A0ABT9E643_9PROT|nr:methylthioribulose 1-phosphate dehydratase [Paracraurococcus sp. LOR1-02]MDO9711649.1 methylthioribulose 1-phosphate dehydratase [Paracraurococcus sp. LOR1-02]